MTIIELLNDDLSYSDILRDSTGKAIKAEDGSWRRWYKIEDTFSNDFDNMETVLEDLLSECEEVYGFIFKLSVLLENMGYSDSAVLDMYMFNEIFGDYSPMELLRKLDLEHFNPWDNYFSYDPVSGFYSGNDIYDFQDVAELNDIIEMIQDDAEQLLAFIRGEYSEGFDGVQGRSREILVRFCDYLGQSSEAELEDDLRRSAII